MGKRIQKLALKNLGTKVLNLGYVGENEHTQIIIDCSEVLWDYSNAVASVVVQPPRGDMYPVEVTRDGDNITWEIADSDLIYAGTGRVQITFTNNGEIVKSAIGNTRIEASIMATGTVPTPLENWMEQAEETARQMGQDVADATLDDLAETKDECIAEIEQAGADTRATIPSDYTQLSDDVTELKSAFSDVDDYQYPVQVTKVPNEVVQTSGSIVPMNGYTRTDYIDCNGIAKIKVYSPAATNFAGFFDETKTEFRSQYIGAGTNEYAVPEGKRYFIFSISGNGINDVKIWAKRYYDIVELKDRVDKNEDITIPNIKSHALINSDNIFDYSEKSRLTVSNGYKLTDEGNYSYDPSYKLVKYTVVPGDIYKIVSDHVFQFQNSSETSASGATYRIGITYGAGSFILQAPEEATHLIVSTPVSGTANVFTTKRIIDASGLTILPTVLNDTTSALFENEVVGKWEYTSFDYSPATGAWKTTPIASNLVLNANEDYVLFCGSSNVPNDTVAIELYIKDGDEIKKRASIPKYGHFVKFNTGEYTHVTISLYISTGTAPAQSGTAYAANVVLFKGSDLYIEFVNPPKIPSYDLSMLAEKEESINSLMKDCAINGGSFVFITDYHHWTNDGSGSLNAETSPDLIEHILNHTGVDFVVNNGDLPHVADRLEGSEGMYERIATARRKFDRFIGRIFHNIGNHEWYALEAGGDESTCMITGSEIFGLLLSPIQRQFDGYDGDLSYYIDNKVQKTRYFFIGCDIYCLPTNNNQIPWFMEQLQIVPEGYRIVVFVHRMWASDHESIIGDWKPLADAMDALKARSSAFVYGGITYDYSNSTAIPVAFFAGHSHRDGSLTTVGGIPVIFTTTDAYRAEEGGLTRTLGTNTEQAFDVVQMDFTSRKIYLTRIGAGSNREFSY